MTPNSINTHSKDIIVDDRQLTYINSLTVDETQINFMEEADINISELTAQVVQDTLGIPEKDFVSIKILNKETRRVRDYNKKAIGSYNGGKKEKGGRIN